MRLKDFSRIKQEAADCLLAGIELLRSDNEKTENSHDAVLVKLRSKLLADAFDILVVGEFSSGKSTLINAMLGEKILPTAISPTTATVNIIEYGQSEKVHVYFKDGKQQDIRRQELAEYITSLSQDSDRVAKSIDKVVIDYPSPFCQNDVRIVDTPGLNSSHDDHERATMEYLPRGCAGIMTLPATQFLSESQRRYLKQFRKYLSKMFFVVTWVDGLDPDDSYEDNEQYFREELAGVLECDAMQITLYPVNGYAAEHGQLKESGLADFLQVFEDFLTRDRLAREMILPPLQRADEYVRQYHVRKKMMLDSLPVSTEEFEERIRKMEPQRQEILQKKQQIRAQFDDDSSQIVQHILRYTEVQYERLVSSVENFVQDYSGDIRNHLEIALKEKLRKEMVDLLASVEQYTQQQFQSLADNMEILDGRMRASIQAYQKEFVSNDKMVVKKNDTLLTPQVVGFVGTTGIIGIVGIAGMLILGPLGLIAGVIAPLFCGGVMDTIENKFRQVGRSYVLNDIAQNMRSQLSPYSAGLERRLKDQLKQAVEQFGSDIDQQYSEMLASIDQTVEAIRHEKQCARQEVEARQALLRGDMQQAVSLQQRIRRLQDAFEA